MKLNIKNIPAKSRKADKEKGFTILELLFAITILSVGILAVASMQAASIRANAFASDVSKGTVWAADKMEELIALAYNDYGNAALADTDGDGDGGLDDDTTATADGSETQTPTDDPKTYTILWNVSVDSLMTNTKTIKVIVTWTEHGVKKNVSMRYVVPKVS